MPISDTKQVQTMVNIAGQQIQVVRAAVQTIKDVRSAYQALNPDTTGTPIEGNVAALSQALNALDAAASDAVWEVLIAGIVKSHRNKALDQ